LEAARLLLYVASIVLSAALIGRLMPLRVRLARLLAATMAAWLINSLFLMSYLVWHLITGEPVAPWRHWTVTLDAFLLALLPALLYWTLDGKER